MEGRDGEGGEGRVFPFSEVVSAPLHYTNSVCVEREVSCKQS